MPLFEPGDSLLSAVDKQKLAAIGGAVSAFYDAPKTPHLLDEEFAGALPGTWSAWQANTSPDGITVQASKFGGWLGYPISLLSDTPPAIFSPTQDPPHVVCNPSARRSYLVLGEGRGSVAYFYGRQFVVGAAHTFRARISNMGDTIASSNISGMFKLCIAGDINGVPNFGDPNAAASGCSISVGWHPSGVGAAQVVAFSQLINRAELGVAGVTPYNSIPGDFEVILCIQGQYSHAFIKTASTITYLGTLGRPSSSTCWVGFLWGSDYPCVNGISRLCATDYLRQQDDLIIL